MKEIDFKNWLLKTGNKPKVASDAVYRLRRVERELKGYQLDNEFKKDKCVYLLSLFANSGKNERMVKIKTNLPIGASYMATYIHAIKQYVNFLESLN